MPHQCLKCGLLFHEGTTTILRGCPECRGTRFFFTQEPLTSTERENLLQSSEVTLREAVEKLVAQAKEGALSPNGVDWVEVPGADADLGAARLEPPKRVNFAAILQKVAPAATQDTRKAPPPASMPAAADPPKARMLPGNRLLIQVARQPKRRKADVRWDYEAPASSPPAAPQVVYRKDSPEPPGPAPAANADPSTALTPPADAPSTPKPDPVQQTLPLVGPAQPPAPPAAIPLPDAVVAQPLVPLIDRASRIENPTGDEPETIRIEKPGLYAIDVKRLLEDSPIVVQRDGTYLIHLPSLFDSNNKKPR